MTNAHRKVQEARVLAGMASALLGVAGFLMESWLVSGLALFCALAWLVLGIICVNLIIDEEAPRHRKEK